MKSDKRSLSTHEVQMQNDRKFCNIKDIMSETIPNPNIENTEIRKYDE